MTNYYFISSPFHLFLACNLSIENSNDKNVAIIIPKITNIKVVSNTFIKAMKSAENIFSESISFERTNDDMPFRSKHDERKYRFGIIKPLLEKEPADRIYTGNDRRIEFQFAMHIANKYRDNVTGIYMDDGMATYLGHKSMNSIVHKYIEPLIKKVVYGRWWKHPNTSGGSAWIDTLYAAFPKLVHFSVKNKPIKSINYDIFKTEKFRDFCLKQLEQYDVDANKIENIKVLVVITHESFYPNGYQHIVNVIKKAKQLTDEKHIAIKAHPRSEKIAELENDFPNCMHIGNKLGFEMLLPLLPDDCTLIGDASTAVFTARWLKPEMKIRAVKIIDKSREELHKELKKLYTKINVPLVNMNDDW
ncbi:MAG: hypothetical protein COB38_06210 [Gammaproteobacteria bacterium]|nr:MAG: hypothetical protein COB38_06210 [Gammaproteobacteria bacterium]